MTNKIIKNEIQNKNIKNIAHNNLGITLKRRNIILYNIIFSIIL